MSDQGRWTVTVRVSRSKGDAPPRVDSFLLEVDPEEYVLDAVERVWAFHDRSVTFRHACHHSTCGACGMRVNGVEKLTCITRIRDVTHDGGTIAVAPLRNFPVVSDLVVDMTPLYSMMDRIGFQEVVPARATLAPGERALEDDGEILRLVDCIECGLCLSACPVAATDPSYVGPAVLAAIQHGGLNDNGRAVGDDHEGAWRCHSAFECTAVCPAFVDPAGRIMDLRKQLVVDRLKQLFRAKRRHSDDLAPA
jgi:succinate dehydrogenase/fumarate reductase iron-sulfur protein